MPKEQTKPRILIVFSRNTGDTSTRFGGFVKRIKANGGFAYADVDYVALEDLVFEIKNKDEARVYDPARNIDLKDYSFVYFKSWQSMPVWASAAAHYLEGIGVPYADKQVRHSYMEKTPNYMIMWAADVSVPATIWGSQKSLRYALENDLLGYPVIVKAVFGEKGKDNFLARTREEALDIIENTTTEMLLQQFIPNDGDYRIGVYGDRARWAIYRKSGGKSHLNNTSAGGSAEQLDVKSVSEDILALAEDAARVCDLSISGVDVVVNKETGELYILEANQGSQIVTGAFTDTNMAAFDAGMKAMLKRAKKASQRKTIGRHTDVILEGLDTPVKMQAKVDTGAYQSSMHVESADLKSDEDGDYVEYSVKDPETGAEQVVKTYEFWRALIKNSFGIEQSRFVVPIQLQINGVQYDTRVSLADRSTQKYPFLIGRKLLKGNFIVNVELSAVEENK